MDQGREEGGAGDGGLDGLQRGGNGKAAETHLDDGAQHTADRARRDGGEEHLPRLVGLALGLEPKALGMQCHIVKPTSVIDWSTSVVGRRQRRHLTP